MSPPSYLVVKLAAAGDVLLTTALTRALRLARPKSHIGWLTTQYAAELLEGNPDVDEVITLPTPTPRGRVGLGWAAACLTELRRWGQRQGEVQVLLAHRSGRLRALLGLADLGNIASWRELWPGAGSGGGVEPHRLDLQAALLAAVGIGVGARGELSPRLCLRPEERREGERIWGRGDCPRWAIAPGGGANPWSAMPNRRWAPHRFLELGQRASGAGIALRWLGGAGDAAVTAWIAEQLGAESDNYAGRLSLRQTAAVCAGADLVIGNDSLALVMAHALERPGLGLYGPTSGHSIHAREQPWLQGAVECGPCYDPGAGARGQAYRCPRARCMEAIEVDEVWRLARRAGLGAGGERICVVGSIGMAASVRGTLAAPA